MLRDQNFRRAAAVNHDEDTYTPTKDDRFQVSRFVTLTVDLEDRIVSLKGDSTTVKRSERRAVRNFLTLDA